MDRGHHVSTRGDVTADEALDVARLMRALSTASRVRILARLRAQESTVGELTAAVGMEQPAVSHQLRILRDLGLVSGTRNGRHVVYGLFDGHVARLIDEALRHIEHVNDRAVPQAEPTRTVALHR
jgi:DNA-binding transcriptional ArsR family regulator